MINRIIYLLLLNLIVYFRTIYFGYVGDDMEVATHKRESYKTRWHWYWGQFIGSCHRDTMSAHFITVLVHSVVCVTIYLVLGMNTVSFLAAALFAINPVNIQGSVWISGRNYATSSILTLLMFACPILSVIPYYCTSFFAVNAWFAPLVFLWTPHWYWASMIPFVFLITKRNKAILHRKLWETVGGTKTTNTEMRAMKPDKLIIFTKTLGYYFRLCLVPWRLGIDHKFLYGFGTNKTDNEIGYRINGDFWIGVACGLTPFVAFFLGYRAIGWGLWWFCINIAMWCNFITIQQQISQRYTYLACIGLMYALANLIIAYPIIITVFLAGYLARLWYIMPSYINDYWAVEYCIVESKTFHYMWMMRAVKKYFAKDFQGAFYDLNEAYLWKPYDFKVLFNLSVVFLVLGNLGESRKFLQLARENVYDEMESEIGKEVKVVEEAQQNVEEQLKKGPTVNIDLKKLMVVK